MSANEYPIPARKNLFILVLAIAASGTLLWGASHATNWALIIACAIAFSFTANTLFSLLHEAVHGIFNANKSINEWAGRLAAAWFPTGLLIQRAFHLTHHKNNRSEHEQFDLIHKTDKVWLKHAQWYAILTGIYWFVAVFGVLIYALIPRAFNLDVFRSKKLEQTSSPAYAESLDGMNTLRARLEILFSIAFQVGLFLALDLSLLGWLVCYVAFAMNWSSLQYADHAFSPLNAKEGAWNLRVSPVSKAFFLNYHLHLAHHQSPHTPWIHLPELVDPARSEPSFWRVYLRMWRGPLRADSEMPKVTEPGLFALPKQDDAARVWGLVMFFAFSFCLFHGLASLLSGFIPWRIPIDFSWEATIPFVPEATIVYLSTSLLLLLLPLVLRSWRELLPVFVALCFQTIIATIFFILLPVDPAFGERMADGPVAMIFHLADTLNMERNFLPSLNVAFGFTAVIALAPKFSRSGRCLIGLWAVAISLSTLFIHENHVLGIIAGFVLALITMRTVARWFARPSVLDAIDVELLCFANMWQFGKRHPRYWLIALGLLKGSVPHWRKRRVLRTGFCLLQEIDDLVDGDRSCDGEPLDLVEDVAQAIESSQFGDTKLMRLARAFNEDLRDVGGDVATKQALRLIRVMCRDRMRVLQNEIWQKDKLEEHLKETFTLSIDLLLIAINAEVRASDFPQLIEAFCWCSVMRDLEEDMEAGLINVPEEVFIETEQAAMDYKELIASQSGRSWMKEGLLSAKVLLDATDHQLKALGKKRGSELLAMFARSIRNFADKRLPKRYPFLLNGVEK